MKEIIVCLILYLALVSCKDSESEIKKNDEIVSVKYFKNIENETLTNWQEYYQKNIDKNFTLDKFKFVSESKFKPLQGTIIGVFHKEFDKNYTDFLIYSPNKQKYIDIDSYHLYIEENKEFSFDIDQEIDLVDIPNKKIERVEFFGPSTWVEDAYWENDSVFVLLENNDIKRPIINKMYINSKRSLVYQYVETLKVDSEYKMERISKKLNLKSL